MEERDLVSLCPFATMSLFSSPHKQSGVVCKLLRHVAQQLRLLVQFDQSIEDKANDIFRSHIQLVTFSRPIVGGGGVYLAGRGASVRLAADKSGCAHPYLPQN